MSVIRDFDFKLFITYLGRPYESDVSDRFLRRHGHRLVEETEESANYLIYLNSHLI